MIRRWNAGNKNNEDNNRLNIAISMRNACTKEKSGGSDKDSPASASHYVVQEKSAVLHVADTSHDWNKCSDDRYKSAKNDSSTAVFFIKKFCLLRIFFIKKKRSFFGKKSRPNPLAENVANMVAENSRYEKPEKKPACRDKSLRSQETSSEQQRITRQKKTKEKSRLGKDDTKNTDKTDSLNDGDRISEEVE